MKGRQERNSQQMIPPILQLQELQLQKLLQLRITLYKIQMTVKQTQIQPKNLVLLQIQTLIQIQLQI